MLWTLRSRSESFYAESRASPTCCGPPARSRGASHQRESSATQADELDIEPRSHVGLWWKADQRGWGPGQDFVTVQSKELPR